MFQGKRSSKADSTTVLEAIGRALALIEFDPQGKILWANPVFCETMGYRLADIVGRHHSLFVEPGFANSEAYRTFWRDLGRGQFSRGEFMRLGAGGREVWLQASYNPVLNARGDVVKVVKVAIDTTEQKLKAVEIDSRMQALDRVQAIIEFSPDGAILDANANFCKAVGYEPQQIKGKHHRIFVDPAYANSADYTEFWARLNRGEFVAGEFQRFGKGGSVVWLQASYNPVFDPNGRITKVVKFATDVTGRVHAVNKIGDGLAALAGKNLACRIDQTFEPAFEKLRSDFNAAVDQLQKTLTAISASAGAVANGSIEIATASDDLSRRTEQQAASLEETAAALDQITATVKRSAEGARQANGAASAAKADAVRSGAVMDDAVQAMSEIAESSRQITQIIGVIDEIAFQTNLLALNAGVEAARAGDAGRGFAVVAQEVRALAQRSAEAAREIKALIASSSGQVERGVQLVSATGEALKAIVVKVADIDGLISEIARSSQEQSTGLNEVNTAVNQMDQVTQQNAAMVEEATAAAAGLRGEAGELNRLIRDFDLGAGRSHGPELVSDPRRHAPAPSPAARQQARLAGALRVAGGGGEWEEL